MRPHRPRRAAGTLLAVVVMLALVACNSTPPRRVNDACQLFQQKSKWKKHTRRAAAKWNANAAVMLAIMHQESRFDADAKPKRRRIFGFPIGRKSSAYGYPQAIDETWRVYQKTAGNRFADRDDFADSIDFIGWYTAQSKKRLRVSATDAYRNYLAYHEGWGGYARGTYRNKTWLKNVAKKVSAQASRYRRQLIRCG